MIRKQKSHRLATWTEHAAHVFVVLKLINHGGESCPSVVDAHVVIGDEGARTFTLSSPLRRWYLVPPWTGYHWIFRDRAISLSDQIEQKRSQLIFPVLSPKHAGLYCYQLGSKEAMVHLLVKSTFS